MSISEIFQIITLVTGVIYVILEILQKNSMWILGVITSLGSMAVYGMIFVQSLAPDAAQPGNGLMMFVLYGYYTAISFYGLYKWKFYKRIASLGSPSTESRPTDADPSARANDVDPSDPAPEVAPVEAPAAEVKDEIVMNHLGKKEVTLGIALFVAGMVLLPEFLKGINLWTENLSSWLSILNVVLSALGTYWLTKAYIQQWYIWILANIAWVWYNVNEGLWWMTALSVVYVFSAIYGYIHWKKHGHYLA